MTDSPPDSDVVALADAVSRLLYGVAGWLSIVVGFMAAGAVVFALADGLTLANALIATIMLAVAVLFVGLGAYVSPRFRRRLDRRRSPSTFGRVHSVDRRVIRPDEDCDERCVSCESRIEKGLVRRFREEYAVAGVPVYTSSEGYNHYCLECASGELLDADPATTGREGQRDRDPTATDGDPALERE